ncbi:adenylate kinase isoenzyme 5 [Ischnura elegans]|uniref:adenylate kinase isoenzyme 5 n=1 Tax=Ischnura elegans TaxID=197161 RepID=UPI001ED8AD6C|nr:adenylate kinase isoenzyme 5 [Ischnura elegans]
MQITFTEQQKSSTRGDESSEEEDDDSSRAASNTSNRRGQSPGPADAALAAPIAFESPRVPVIFVIGGPGSGKVTHCDNLALERPVIVHINMADLLQQYAVGSDLKDMGELSSKTVIEVLMLEMKMAANAEAYLISGFPRNMRDVVEYSEKIKVVTGVILVSWRRKVLERQVAYGAKLGHVILRVARMELRYFYHHTISVAEYFDQQGMLIAIDGERDPSEVYEDFKAIVYRLLNEENLADKAANRTTREPAEEFNVPVLAHRHAITNMRGPQQPRTLAVSVETHQPSRTRYPPVIWILGGPGSNKASLCSRALRKSGTSTAEWVQLSIGRTLRAMALSSGTIPADKRTPIRLLPTSRTPSPTNPVISSNWATNKYPHLRPLLSTGEMAPEGDVEGIVESQMERSAQDGAKGILIDGYPRDLGQLTSFETKYGQQPMLILLDCSKLQLGRGHLDDNVPAFRRRLQLFRELTLPMLKMLDQSNRLIIVDGDTDSPSVQDEFYQAVMQLIAEISSKQRRRVESKQNLQANGFAGRSGTVLTPVAAVHALRHREILEGIENDVPNGDARADGRTHEARNGVGMRGIANGKQLANRQRRNVMGNGITRALQQPPPPPYQPHYAIQDSYM